MPSGQRLKFQGTTMSVATSYTGTQAITAATKAKPCVLTCTGNTFVVGDVIKPASIVGMTELNGNSYIVSAVAGAAVTLFDTDSTGYGTYVSGGTAPVAVFSPFCELTSVKRGGGAAAEIEVSTICSDVTEYELGISSNGTLDLEFNFAPTALVQAALKTAKTAGTPVAVKRILPKTAGSTVWMGLVKAINENGGLNDVWKGDCSIRLTGAEYNY